ncbi:hypothetical protein Hanom_Chr12g01100051 [Helianthus anomalus]
MIKKNLWELKEHVLLEMLQALREAELLNFIICLKIFTFEVSLVGRRVSYLAFG